MMGSKSTTGEQAQEELLDIPVDPFATTRAMRSGRVRDFLIASLANPDPLRANLGSISSGLMRISQSLEEGIQRALGNGHVSIEQLQKVLSPIDTYLRVTRQIDRFGQLDMRVEEVRRGKQPAVSSPPATGPTAQSEETAF
jgi:hypothetical protein